MKGWFVVNEFLQGDGFREHNELFLAAAKKLGIDLELKTNAEVWTELASCSYCLKNETALPSFVLFWDKDICLAHELTRQGLRLYNPAQAIEDCDDKALTYLKLSHAGIRQPATLISPKKFYSDGLLHRGFFEKAIETTGFPCIVKECAGSFGQQVYLVEDRSALKRLLKELGDHPYLIQRFIASSRGRDLRIMVVGNRVVAAMERFNPTDFRSNIANGGNARMVTIDAEYEKMALSACRALKLDFAGVDLLYGENGEPFLCEVNSNAHFKMLYACTGVNVAEEIMMYINRRETK